LFCLGHTVGTISGSSPGGSADAVLAMMRSVRCTEDCQIGTAFAGHHAA